MHCARLMESPVSINGKPILRDYNKRQQNILFLKTIRFDFFYLLSQKE